MQFSQYPETYDSELDTLAQYAKQHAQRSATRPIAASTESLNAALLSLPHDLPHHGIGFEESVKMIYDQIMPALTLGQPGPRYFGFVTGGVAPAAQ